RRARTRRRRLAAGPPSRKWNVPPKRLSHPARAKSSSASERLPPMSTLRLALVGAGRMGSLHARALARGVDGIELAAVVEPSAEAAARLPGTARRYADAAGLLVAGGVEGAIVAVPTRLHADVVGQLPDAGLPGPCEKPCGLTSEATGS